MKDDKIDFVITWVDDTDEEWLKQKKKYLQEKNDESGSKIRYRNWEFLKYWFRAVEKNANWVNKIYFVTCGQVPQWLDTSNPKLVLVNHSEYIPNEYLPTFNSNVIEMFFNRIDGLSNKFVYFNDDVILTDKVEKTDFFCGDKVKDALIFNAVSIKGKNSIIEHTILNDLELLSKYFTKRQVEENNRGKIYNPKYGKLAIKSFLLKPWKYFTGMENMHTAMPYIKETWNEVWNKEENELLSTAKNKFRTKYDYNHWLFKYWQMFKGNFEIVNYKKHKYYDLKNENVDFCNDVLKKKYKVVCINDSDENLNFDLVKEELHQMFEKMYPNKSTFEK